MFSLLPSIFLLVPMADRSIVTLIGSPAMRSLHLAFDVTLPLHAKIGNLSIVDAKEQVQCSLDPVRPDLPAQSDRLLVCLGQTKQFQRVPVPCRLGLEFNESNGLEFSQEDSLFWLEIEPLKDAFEAKLAYRDPDGKTIYQSVWQMVPQETPLQTVDEFAVGTPFRELAETRYWGPDLFVELYGKGAQIHRLEIGPLSNANLVDLSSNEWLVFRDNKWEKIDHLSDVKALQIAHVKSYSGKGLEVEGWDGSSHVRLQLQQTQATPLKVRSEDLFSQLRIRSEKQISCIFDKHCLILRPGDWVLKVDQRWKILRNAEEKESLLEGKLVGDIFVLDRIDAKSSSKSIAGHYFGAGRSQMVLIEHLLQPHRSRRQAELVSKRKKR